MQPHPFSCRHHPTFWPNAAEYAHRSSSFLSNPPSGLVSSSSKVKPNDQWSLKELLPLLSTCKDEIFNIVFRSIHRVESEVHQRFAKGKKEQHSKTLDDLVDTYLFVFEQLMLYLPDEIHNDHWKLPEMEIVLAKLLNPRNHIKVLKVGVRCTTLWCSILGVRMTPKCWRLYNTMISLFDVETWCRPAAAASTTTATATATATATVTATATPASPSTMGGGVTLRLSPTASPTASPKASPKPLPKCSPKSKRKTGSFAALDENQHPTPTHPTHRYPPPLYPDTSATPATTTTSSSASSSFASDEPDGGIFIVARLVDIFLEAMTNSVLDESGQNDAVSGGGGGGSGSSTTVSAAETTTRYSTTQFFFLYEAWCRFHLPIAYPNTFLPSRDAAALAEQEALPSHLRTHSSTDALAASSEAAPRTPNYLDLPADGQLSEGGAAAPPPLTLPQEAQAAQQRNAETMLAHVRMVIVQWFIFWFKSQSPRCLAIQAQFCWRKRDLGVVHAIFGEALKLPIENVRCYTLTYILYYFHVECRTL